MVEIDAQLCLPVENSSRNDFGHLLVVGFASTIFSILCHAETSCQWYNDGYVECYTIQGNTRRIQVTGKSLNQVHIYAANNFVKYLEADFKDSTRFFAIQPGSFRTIIRKNSTKYLMSYSIELKPVSKSMNHIRTVDMRGSVVHGENPKETAEKINAQKVPRWQNSMEKKYGNMQYLVATDSSEKSFYHEAILGVGIQVQPK